MSEERLLSPSLLAKLLFSVCIPGIIIPINPGTSNLSPFFCSLSFSLFKINAKLVLFFGSEINVLSKPHYQSPARCSGFPIRKLINPRFSIPIIITPEVSYYRHTRPFYKLWTTEGSISLYLNYSNHYKCSNKNY